MVNFSLSDSESDHNSIQVSPFFSPQERWGQIELSTIGTLLPIVHLLILALKEIFLGNSKN